MNKSNELEVENVKKLLVRFSIPAVIGMLVNALYSVVDRIFVGRGVNSIALSGVAITFPITNIIMGIGMLVGTGAAAVVSIKLGQKKNKEAEKVIGNAYVLVIILSVLLTIFGLMFLDPLLKLLGASKETMPYAKQFSVIVLWGTLLQNIGFGLNAIIRSEGDPKTAMLTMLIGAILNFIMNPLFIFGFKFGVRGSALATIISQAVCSIWIFIYFTKGKSMLKLKKENLKLDIKIIKEILAIGMSPFAMQVAASLVTFTFNNTLAQYGGDRAIAAFSLISSIGVLIIMPIIGINQGAQPIIGYNYGARKVDRIKSTLKYQCIACTCISTFGFLMVQLFPLQIIRIFNRTDAKLATIGASGIVIFLSMFAFVGAQTAFANYFQAVGKAQKSMFLSLLRQIILLIPLVILLPHFFKLNGVWMAGAVSDFLSTVVSVIMIAYEMKNLNKLKDEAEKVAV